MSLLSEIEKTIERAFRKFTERAFGPAESDELLLVHRAILEEVQSKVQTVQRGRRVMPYNALHVKLVSPEADRRALFQAAFAQDHRLENDIREALEGGGYALPAGFAVEVETAAEGAKGFEISYAIREAATAPPTETSAPAPDPAPAPAPTAVFNPGRLVVVRGKASQESYLLDKGRTNIGRLEELTDSQHHLVRRNDVVFDEGADDAKATVSRAHAHIRRDRDAGQYRLCDDDSEFGTRIFREGRSIEVPAGNRRGERLCGGDEIYLGRACVRFEQPS